MRVTPIIYPKVVFHEWYQLFAVAPKTKSGNLLKLRCLSLGNTNEKVSVTPKILFDKNVIVLLKFNISLFWVECYWNKNLQ